jgi:two-component system, NtrC family, nitrogen regulation response regulator NtrX
VKPRLLIVDDEPNIIASLRLILEREGYLVDSAGSIQEARRKWSDQVPNLLLLDVRLSDGSGLDFLKELRPNLHVPVVMISGHASIADAMDAIRTGASDFLEKPLSREKVLVTLKNALLQSRLHQENQALKKVVDTETVIANSGSFRQVMELASRAAGSDIPILLQGESGTGKEVIADLIHRRSSVADGPIVKLNCAAIPAEMLESELFGHEKGAFTGAVNTHIGRFQQADQGTLFLDEVGEMPPAAQAKLLRVLQDGEIQRLGSNRTLRVQVRIVSATNRDLKLAIQQGAFREDLFYRLAGMPIRLPALRERPEDIGPLAVHFLQQFCSRNRRKPLQLEDEVLAQLSAHSWPGNARELKNTVERLAILAAGQTISSADLPVELRESPVQPSAEPLKEVRHRAERDSLISALEKHQWNVSSAAESLRLERTHLHKRMKALGIQRPDKRD